jgi:hypothetical protein
MLPSGDLCASFMFDIRVSERARVGDGAGDGLGCSGVGVHHAEMITGYLKDQRVMWIPR